MEFIFSLFNGFGFLSLLFLPFVSIIVLLYFLIKPNKYRYIVLLIGSLGFIALVSYKSLLFIVPTALFVYLASFLIFRFKDKNKLKLFIIIISIVMIVSVLMLLKYFNFLGFTFSRITSTPFRAIDFIIPIGLSYYTFQSIAYLVDTYKNKITPTKNPFKLMLFISFFPIITMGPILRYEEISDVIDNGTSFSQDTFIKGLKRIAFGYMKKIIIADLIAIPVAWIFKNYNDYYGWSLIFGAILYSVEIYCDFSGYMDIALGVANLFNINLVENFDTPYMSPSIQIFWRRWHMSLTRWFKDYIYIPLGGNRVNKFRWILNILIVWLITGIWHGAGLTFIAWGLYNAILLIIAGLISKPFNSFKDKHQKVFNSKIYKILQIIKTFILVSIGWVFFNSSSLLDAFKYLYQSLFIFKATGLLTSIKTIDYWAWVAALVTIIICVIFYSYFSSKENKYFSFLNKFKINKFGKVITPIIISFCFIAAIIMLYYQFCLNGGNIGGFIYFDF